MHGTSRNAPTARSTTARFGGYSVCGKPCPLELHPGTAVVIPRHVGAPADDVCFTVRPHLPGRCPAIPVEVERADVVRKGGIGADRGARTFQATLPGRRRGRTDGADVHVDRRSATTGMPTTTTVSVS